MCIPKGEHTHLTEEDFLLTSAPLAHKRGISNSLCSAPVGQVQVGAGSKLFLKSQIVNISRSQALRSLLPPLRAALELERGHGQGVRCSLGVAVFQRNLIETCLWPVAHHPLVWAWRPICGLFESPHPCQPLFPVPSPPQF